MSDEKTTEMERSDTAEDEAETEAETETETESEATLDIEAAVEREETVEALREQLDEQQERIQELEGLVLDLSTRVADDRATGVCPDCHGPVVKVKPWLRSAKIKCTSCGRVFHEY
jgi:CBS domain containing-hemolysin-like protein